jgi:hypothetical protein
MSFDISHLNLLNLAALEGAVVGEELETAETTWLKERWGKFTASEMHRLMTNGRAKDSLSAGALTYIIEKVAEELSVFRRNDFSNAAIEWGKEHELEAIQAFELETGVRINNTGENQQFILSDCGHWGGTPDGITFDSGVEIKCPESKNHLLYLAIQDAETLKNTEIKYYWQIQVYLALTGKSYWYFVSYDPRFKSEKLRLHYAQINRVEEDIELMRSRIEAAVAHKDSMARVVTNG